MHSEDIQEQRAYHSRPAARPPSRQQPPPQQTASPHYVGTNAGMHPVDAPYTTDDVLDDEEEEGYDDDVFPRLPTSTRRYPGAPHGHGGNTGRPNTPIPPRSSRQAVAHNVPEVVQINGQFYKVKQLDSVPAAPQRRVPGRPQYQPPIADRPTEERLPVEQQRQPRSTTRPHWLLPLGMGMIGMLLLWFVASTAYNLLQIKLNDWTYGRPRTYTIDAVVGHNHDSVLNPSHFIVQNWGKRILIIEFPGGDVSKAFSMQGPTLVGDGTELTPVTLTFADVSGDGKPDMILHIGDQKFYLINDQGKFRMPKPGEVKP